MTVAARDRLFGWLLALPGLVVLLALVLAPALLTLAGSVLDLTLPELKPGRTVGLSHHAAALGTPELRQALLLTLLFALAAALTELLLGFVVALALNAVRRGRSVYQAILILPLLVSPVAVGLTSRMLLDPLRWPSDPGSAFWTLVGLDAWQNVSLMAVLLLAGLRTLPREPYEAARMEGAGALRAFLRVTLPLLRPVLLVVLLVRLILALRTFDLAYILIQGGPERTTTDLLSHLIYREAVVPLDLGRACAMAAILLLIVLPLTAWLHRSMRSLAD